MFTNWRKPYDGVRKRFAEQALLRKIPLGNSIGELDLHPIDDHAVAARRLGSVEG
jgi:hypothetical protein